MGNPNSEAMTSPSVTHSFEASRPTELSGSSDLRLLPNRLAAGANFPG